VNENHAELCSSPEWAAYVRDDVLPPIFALAELGDEMLEIGPGPGAATACLMQHVERLTVVEVDEDAAKRLAERFAGSDVEVVVASATELHWPEDSFDSVGCFTMLHHVPELELQDRIIAEAFRVLRPGGVFIGSDSLASEDLRRFHEGDTYNPIAPGRLLDYLRGLGFTKVTVLVDHDLRFAARKPKGDEHDGC